MAQTTRVDTSDIPIGLSSRGIAGAGNPGRTGSIPPLAAGYVDTYNVGYAAGYAAAAPDVVPPTVTVVSPAGLVFPADPAAAAETPIVLRLADTTNAVTPPGLALAVLTISFPLATPARAPEPAYRRGAFVTGYLNGSSQRVISSTEIEVTIRRDAGWPVGSGTLGDLRIDIDTVDHAGNLS